MESHQLIGVICKRSCIYIISLHPYRLVDAVYSRGHDSLSTSYENVVLCCHCRISV